MAEQHIVEQIWAYKEAHPQADSIPLTPEQEAALVAWHEEIWGKDWPVTPMTDFLQKREIYGLKF